MGDQEFSRAVDSEEVRRNTSTITRQMTTTNSQVTSKEEQFISAVADLAIQDFIQMAKTGVEKEGPGSLVINLLEDSMTYMSLDTVDAGLKEAERETDEDTVSNLRTMVNRIEGNDWSNHVLITLVTPVGTRTMALEASLAYSD